MRLAKDVKFKDHILPVCLPSYHQSFGGQYAKVIGWGRQAHGEKEDGEPPPVNGLRYRFLFAGVSSTPSVLQEVSVRVISADTCQSWYRKAGRKERIYADNFICAGYEEGGRDSCQVLVDVIFRLLYAVAVVAVAAIAGASNVIAKTFAAVL